MWSWCEWIKWTGNIIFTSSWCTKSHLRWGSLTWSSCTGEGWKRFRFILAWHQGVSKSLIATICVPQTRQTSKIWSYTPFITAGTQSHHTWYYYFVSAWVPWTLSGDQTTPILSHLMICVWTSRPVIGLAGFYERVISSWTLRYWPTCPYESPCSCTLRATFIGICSCFWGFIFTLVRPFSSFSLRFIAPKVFIWTYWLSSW